MAQPSTVKIEAPRTQPMRMPRRWWRRNITFATIVGVLGLIAIVEGIALYQTLSDHESEQQSVARYDASRDTQARETKTAAWDDAIVVGQAGRGRWQHAARVARDSRVRFRGAARRLAGR